MSESKKSWKSDLTKAMEIVKAEHAKGGFEEHILNIFKAALATTPLGGFFASLISDYIPSSKELRIEQFMIDTANTLTRYQDQIDAQRIKTDHYAYIFEQCIRGVAQHPQKEKIECYKAILINAAKPTEDSDEQQDYFLNLVNTLSPIHIRLIGALHAAAKVPQNGPETSRTIRTLIGADVDGDILMSAASELYQLQFTNTPPTSIPFTADLSRTGGRLTPIAMKFIEFCTLNA